MSSLWNLDRSAALQLQPSAFAVTHEMHPRWNDNDSYGHVNNAVYYEYFDTAINNWMLEGLPNSESRESIMMFVVESACRYLGELQYPSPMLIAHRVTELGRSSVTHELGIFADIESDSPRLAALGRWVHVCVDSGTKKPVSIPDDFRELLSSAIVAPAV